jgi:adenylylsulfate kinase
MKVTKRRSLLKSISWRVIGTSLTAMLFYLFTGEAVNILVQFGIIDTVLKIASFYMHERMWNKIEWGIEPDED